MLISFTFDAGVQQSYSSSFSFWSKSACTNAMFIIWSDYSIFTKYQLFIIQLQFYQKIKECDYMHCFINLIRYLLSFLVYLILQIPNFGVYCRWYINFFLGFSFADIFLSSLLLDKLFLIFHLELLLLGFRQDWLGFLFCVSYRQCIQTIFWL
ncbi:Hypothetical_protein [Hexamita inflata]|uniref:Hypothetical_protein n=1 Tax=Hexamita inflata TaxID=28002 RepID=A0AA86R7C7_9EUKA|nr:Hypothetical protein HINF_LOCUS56246 [Hexamita inflata]